MALGMCFGLSLGSSFSVFFHGNMALGATMGMSLGMLLGLTIGAQKDKAINAQLEEKGYTIKTIEKNENTNDYTVTIMDHSDTETTVVVPKGQMETELFSVGDIIFLDEDGHMEQAFEDEKE